MLACVSYLSLSLESTAFWCSVLLIRIPHQSKTRPNPLCYVRREPTYLLPVNTRVVRLQHDKPLLRHVQARGLNLFRRRVVLVRVHDGLQFLRCGVEARAVCPDRGPVGREDGGAVDGAGADQAVGGR